MKSQREIKSNKENNFKYLPMLCMISIVFLNIAIIFTYRIVEIGPLLTPAGAYIFPVTYLIADIVAEVYGYKKARFLIYGNIFSILIFNISGYLLLQMPTPTNAIHDSAYHFIFENSIRVVLAYCIGFSLGDFLNAYAISKWRILTKGKYFVTRAITSCAIGQIIFSIVASLILYSHQFNFTTLLQQFLTTISVKIGIILLLSYPCLIVVIFLKNAENRNLQKESIEINPFMFSDKKN